MKWLIYTILWRCIYVYIIFKKMIKQLRYFTLTNFVKTFVLECKANTHNKGHYHASILT